MKHKLRRCLLVMGCIAGAWMFHSTTALSGELPNILWISCEDINPQLGCFGDAYANTPNLDRFATGALRYRHCWSSAPVCAPARTTLITGVYPPSTGSEHMRSEVAMPAWMKMFPQFLRERGYYCSNNNKEDYNLTKPGKVWDDSSRNAHWRNRKPDQPFFAVFNLEISHESQIRARPHTLQHNPAKAPLPAYHPDTPEVRHDWAQYYDKITAMDAQFGRRLQELADAGLKEETIVFFFGDNGSGMPRSKRWPYNSGLNVPLIIYIPEKFKPLAPKEYTAGAATDRLVAFVDFAPTLLSLAGLQSPEWMQGHAFLGRYEEPPQRYLHGFRGRMDERYDLVRSVRNQRFIYIRNYLPHLIYGQYLDYMFQTPTTRVWKQLYDAGKLKPPQTYFWETKPPEELYDLETDPDEVKNLIHAAEYQQVLNDLRAAQQEQVRQIRDVGFLTEAEQHSRSTGTTMYEMGHNPQAYPLEHITAMADTASLLKTDALRQLRAGLKDNDSAVRYWAAMGFLMRGAHAVEAVREELRAALQDSSPSVRIAAACALGQYDNGADLELALTVLAALAPPDKNGAYVSILALNAIDALGQKARPLMETLRTMPMKDPRAVERANSYVSRLVEYIKISSGEQKAGKAVISGERKQWHKVTLTVDGPEAKESDVNPNPFTDYHMTVAFTHESGAPQYSVPGYFAADGNAANTSATSGSQWRAHLSPDLPGQWRYQVSFQTGKNVATDPSAPSQPVARCDGLSGVFAIAPSDKTGRDFRGQGRLQYVGRRYLRFAGSGMYFLKAGADAPENFLAFAEFDGTWSRKAGRAAQRPGEATATGLHRYQPHAQDWRPGDPSWGDGKGKNIIGALNYLAGKGCNAFSFLTYNVGGDGDDVWPFIAPEDKFHFDCSKLDQWQIVFDHATARGLHLHFKLQETENDDNRLGQQQGGHLAASLDDGDLGPERKLYLRELIARFAHELALNWNLGEENTQSTEQQRAMAQYIRETDPYHHPIVVHTYPDWQDRVYSPLLGNQSALTGASLQNSWSAAHQRVLQWVTESDKAGKPWVVAFDEQNPPGLGVPPNPGYQDFNGVAREKATDRGYTIDDIRKYALWGALLAGGAGVEYYFGYTLPQNDLGCEDWRSRGQSWDYCRIALAFFKDHSIPFWDMRNADALVGNDKHDNSRYCFAKPGEIYVVYLPTGGTFDLDLENASGSFTVKWYNPRAGGGLQTGSIRELHGPGKAALGQPPSEPDSDWVVLIRR